MTSDFLAKCTQCPFTRSEGTAKLTIEMKAVKHAITKGHTVQIFDSDLLVREVRQEPRQGRLDTHVPF